MWHGDSVGCSGRRRRFGPREPCLQWNGIRTAAIPPPSANFLSAKLFPDGPPQAVWIDRCFPLTPACERFGSGAPIRGKSTRALFQRPWEGPHLKGQFDGCATNLERVACAAAGEGSREDRR